MQLQNSKDLKLLLVWYLLHSKVFVEYKLLDGLKIMVSGILLKMK